MNRLIIYMWFILENIWKNLICKVKHINMYLEQPPRMFIILIFNDF